MGGSGAEGETGGNREETGTASIMTHKRRR